MIAGPQIAKIAADIKGGSSLPKDKTSSLKNKLNPWFSSWQRVTYFSPIIDFKRIKKLPCLKNTQRSVSTQTQGCSTGIGMALGIWMVQAPLGSGWRLEWLKEQGKTNKPQRHNTPPGPDSILQPLQKSPGLFDIPFSSLNLETCKQGELGQQLWAEGRSCRGKWEGSWPGLAVVRGKGSVLLAPVHQTEHTALGQYMALYIWELPGLAHGYSLVPELLCLLSGFYCNSWELSSFSEWPHSWNLLCTCSPQPSE